MIAAFFRKSWIYIVLVLAIVAAALGWKGAAAVAAKMRLERDIAKEDAKNAKAAALRDRELSDQRKEAERLHNERATVIKAELEGFKAEAEVKKAVVDAEVASKGSAIDELNRRILERRNKTP